MVRVSVSTKQNLQVEIQAGPHTLIADEPLDLGGEATGPDPYSLLLSALGA
jgi:putative redox protein